MEEHLQQFQHPNLHLDLFEALDELRLHSRVAADAGRGDLLIELFALPREVEDLAFGIHWIESQTSSRGVAFQYYPNAVKTVM